MGGPKLFSHLYDCNNKDDLLVSFSATNPVAKETVVAVVKRTNLAVTYVEIVVVEIQAVDIALYPASGQDEVAVAAAAAVVIVDMTAAVPAV